MRREISVALLALGQHGIERQLHPVGVAGGGVGLVQFHGSDPRPGGRAGIEAFLAPGAAIGTDAQDRHRHPFRQERLERGNRAYRIGIVVGPCRVLGRGAWTWPVVSTLRGLVDPLGEVPIRPSVFSVQAKAIAASINASRTPSARAYESYLSLARHVRDWLIAQNIAPKDLFDVHDFIWETLRPAARRRIDDLSVTSVTTRPADNPESVAA